VVGPYPVGVGRPGAAGGLRGEGEGTDRGGVCAESDRVGSGPHWTMAITAGLKPSVRTARSAREQRAILPDLHRAAAPHARKLIQSRIS
jgi:hypothetical protein